MSSKVSCSTISENSKVKGTVFYQNQEYVLTGSCSSYLEGIISVWGNKVTPIEQYRGELKALSYREYRIEVNIGARERGYNGLIVYDHDRALVMEGPVITFLPSGFSNEQMTLF